MTAQLGGALDMLATALWYAKWCGWTVFPVKPGGKIPLIAEGFRQASKDPGQITQWWGRWPDANIGLACAMSGLVALDFDEAKPSYAGADLLEDLRRNFHTTTAITGGGGRHLLYKLPQGAELSNSPGQLPAGVDVRVNGYVVLAPSLHPNGKRYAWEIGPHELMPQPLPAHVLDLLRPAPPEPKPEPGKVSTAEDAQRVTAAVAALASWRAEAYPDWFAVGAAIHAWDGGPVGLELFDAFSKSCPGKYDPEGVQRQWAKYRTIGATNGAKRDVGSLYKWADEDAPGWWRVLPKYQDGSPPLPPVPGDPDSGGPEFAKYRPEDGGLLDAWRELHGARWMFITGYETWHSWAGTHWQADEEQTIHWEIQGLMDRFNREAREAKRAALRVIRAARPDLANGKLPKDDPVAAGLAKLEAMQKEKAAFYESYIAATRRSKARVASVEGMAQAHYAVAGGRLNQGNVLNLANGTLDLDRLELRPHSPEDRLTYVLPYSYDPAAECPRWRRFIAEVLVEEDGQAPDTELAELFQVALGYSLTCDTRYEAMFWLFGTGANGKSTLLAVMQSLLGPLACNVDFSSLGQPGDYTLAELPGKRVIFSTESERGGQVAEGYLKRIVSGEILTARAIYGAPFQFRPQAKLWWAMNDLPRIRDTSNAIWRRLRLIPFHRSFKGKDRDPRLLDTLRGELPGILNFALEGLRRLRDLGQLPESRAVNQAVTTYRSESNPVAQWLSERTEPINQPGARAKELHTDYLRWAKETGGQPLNNTAFGNELTRLGVERSHTRDGRRYHVLLKAIDEP